MSDRLAWLKSLDPASRQWLLKEIRTVLDTDRLQDYRPYPKQHHFHTLGTRYLERMLRAGNQYGKTMSAGAEMAMHLTGEYPHWWWGKRFTRPILGWVTGESGDAVRDNGQRILLGGPGEHGTGWIPKRCLTNVYGRAHGVSDLYSFIRIRHVSGGTSLLRTRYYEQGRKKWQGPTVDVVWLDEEPPKDIFAEAQARTVASGGILMLTFTPILGRSEVVLMFLSPTKRGTARAEVVMKHEDAYHLPPIQALEDKYERHEWEARIYAEPAMGEGLIFPVIEQDFVCKPIEIPSWWPQIGGIDFGYEHPTSAVRLAWDRDTDIVYVTREYRVSKQTPGHHAIALKGWGRLPFAWPHDGEKFQAGTGASLSDDFRKGGLKMLPQHAHFQPNSAESRQGAAGKHRVSVDRGLSMMLERMETGRLKVFKSCTMWQEERRLYHRKDGKVVKKDDDLMDATRYALMMLRHASDGRKRQSVSRPQNWQV